jgi:hypothetical protein
MHTFHIFMCIYVGIYVCIYQCIYFLFFTEPFVNDLQMSWYFNPKCFTTDFLKVRGLYYLYYYFSRLSFDNKTPEEKQTSKGESLMWFTVSGVSVHILFVPLFWGCGGMVHHDGCPHWRELIHLMTAKKQSSPNISSCSQWPNSLPLAPPPKDSTTSQ